MFGFPSWAVLAVVAIFSAGSATYVTREIYTGDIAELKLAHSQALVAAAEQARKTQRDIDAIAMGALEHTVDIQLEVVMQTASIVKEIPFYVQDTSTCITVGLIRVLDAAAIGTDPADLDLAPGEFNETCAGVGARALAGSIVENYGTYHLVSAQLSGLQEYVRGVAKTISAQPTVSTGR